MLTQDEEASSSAVAAADAQEDEYAGVADTGMEECETSERECLDSHSIISFVFRLSIFFLCSTIV
jgi:hypothetical protein